MCALITLLRPAGHVGLCCDASRVSSDEPLPRPSSQVQAAEDILDKYRNIKRTSPSDGATAGASYDGPAGQERAPRKPTLVYGGVTCPSFCRQTFVSRRTSITPHGKILCRTSPQMTSLTLPVRRHSSTTPSFRSGQKSSICPTESTGAAENTQCVGTRQGIVEIT